MHCASSAFRIRFCGYYIQNDATLKAALTGPGVYPMPIGTAGICAVDTRDLAEAAAISLTQDGHDGQTYDLVGPTLISAPGNAAAWSRLLGREIKYAGHNFDEWEQQMRGARDQIENCVDFIAKMRCPKTA
jgi:uncharacterized protein YbjT (DUF2867 family)